MPPLELAIIKLPATIEAAPTTPPTAPVVKIGSVRFVVPLGAAMGGGGIAAGGKSGESGGVTVGAEGVIGVKSVALGGAAGGGLALAGRAPDASGTGA